MHSNEQRWIRTTALGATSSARSTERWEWVESPGNVRASFEVDVTIGKPLDVVGLKGTDLKEIREYAQYLRRSAGELYASTRPRRHVDTCPCCEGDTQSASRAFSVYGVEYARCAWCGHVFVRSQPTQQALEELFAVAEEHSAAYTDKERIELRLAQVVKPKLEWVLETFQRVCGKRATSVLDVGAGGGHFVEACRRAGLTAQGYEISHASCRFAKEAFGIDLWNRDFLSESGGTAAVDLVTLWGLLEYTPEPSRFLAAARARLSGNQGMLVVEVPRYDCFGTAVQQACPETIARHLDPTSHVNCFTDASLATALVRAGFRPVAAWYFGMDAYELVVQTALQLDSWKAVPRLAPLIPILQQSLDSAKLCDDIIVAAVPV